MKRAYGLLLSLSIALAAVSFIAVLGLGSFGRPAPQAADPDAQVVVASRNLSIGTVLTPEMLTTASWPQSQAIDTYVSPTDLVGLVVRRSVAQGDALMVEDFDSALAVPDLVRLIQPGMRAIAVPLNRVDSVGMLLEPGDWVDVLLTIDGAVNDTSVKVVVQNVQILAVLPSQPMASPQPGGSADAPTASASDDLIAILAIQPQQVEVIRFAEVEGRVSLVLRSPADNETGSVSTTGITLEQLVDLYGVLPPPSVTAR